MKHNVLLLVLVAALGGCGKGNAPSSDPGPAKILQPVMTRVVGALTSDGSEVYSGEIRARYETQLGFRIGGKLVARLVDAGARVKAGQVLARLDAADSSLQASSAQAQYQLALEEVQRYRELRSKNFVSQAALDAREATLKAAAAQAGLSGNQTTYTVLRADHAGVIVATLADVGQVVGAGQPVVRLAQDGKREVAIAIPEAQFSGLKLGMHADVTLWSEQNGARHFKGHLRELSPAADPASRTYAARIALDGADTGAALGMTAEVHFQRDRQHRQLLIPLTAIFQKGDQAAVWIVAADHRVSLRPVQVAAYRDDGAAISAGLAKGERIVSAGVNKLSEGEQIRVIEGEFADGNAQ